MGLVNSMGSKKGSTHQAQNGSSTNQTSPSKTSKAKQKEKGTGRSWKRRVWTKVEASLWVIGAAFFLWRGDGIYNLPDVIRLDDNVDRCHPGCINLIECVERAQYRRSLAL